MITKSMSDEELFRALKTEIDELGWNLIKHKGQAYRKVVLRQRLFPLYFKPFEVKSKSKNTWLVIPVAHSRKDADNSQFMLLCKLDSPEGIYWYSIGADYFTREADETISVLAPHMLRRMNERLSLHILKSEDLLVEFIKREPKNYMSYPPESKQFFHLVNGGIVLGEVVGRRWIHKTFIDDESFSKVNKMKGDRLISGQKRLESIKQLLDSSDNKAAVLEFIDSTFGSYKHEFKLE